MGTADRDPRDQRPGVLGTAQRAAADIDRSGCHPCHLLDQSCHGRVLKSDDPGAMRQPLQRLNRTLFGWGIASLLGWSRCTRAGMRTVAGCALRPPDDPSLEDEGSNPDFDQYSGSTYEEVHDAVFKEPYFRAPGVPTSCRTTMSRYRGSPRAFGPGPRLIPFARLHCVRSAARPICAGAKITKACRACCIRTASAWPARGGLLRQPPTRACLPARNRV